MRTLYFDVSCGAAGDMIVGALIDAGADFTVIRDGLASLPVEGYELSAEKAVKKGVTATHFRVQLDENHQQPHRHLHHIEEMIAHNDLPESVKERSQATFRRIAQAEAEVHGCAIEKVHFHEVGAVDSIIDIIGANLALHLLGIEKVYASPLHVGSGTVRCSHGVMPVPAPATALILKGAPIYGGDVDGELVTPTGAALLVEWAERFGPMPVMSADAIGCGSGTRDVPDRPNILRAFVGTMAERSPAPHPIMLMETNLDDMNPELFPTLVEELLAAGARDAFLTPILGKKGRPGYVATALCEADTLEAVRDAFFRAAPTLGVRVRQAERYCMERRWVTAQTPWGPVRIKIGRWRGEDSTHAPEFEDCRRLANEHGVAVRRVYEEALARAVRGETCDA